MRHYDELCNWRPPRRSRSTDDGRFVLQRSLPLTAGIRPLRGRGGSASVRDAQAVDILFDITFAVLDGPCDVQREWQRADWLFVSRLAE